MISSNLPTAVQTDTELAERARLIPGMEFRADDNVEPPSPGSWLFLPTYLDPSSVNSTRDSKIESDRESSKTEGDFDFGLSRTPQGRRRKRDAAQTTWIKGVAKAIGKRLSRL